MEIKQYRKKDKVIEELELAIERNYVRKFWIGCKS